MKPTPQDRQRIEHCLEQLDAWRQSGMALKKYTEHHGHSYPQWRAWLGVEAHWRQTLSGVVPSTFVQARATKAMRPRACASPSKAKAAPSLPASTGLWSARAQPAPWPPSCERCWHERPGHERCSNPDARRRLATGRRTPGHALRHGQHPGDRVVAVFGCAQPHVAYAFANARASRMKVLLHDGFGLWLCARRLHQGSLVWPRGDAPIASLNAQQWSALTVGLPWHRLGRAGEANVIGIV